MFGVRRAGDSFNVSLPFLFTCRMLSFVVFWFPTQFVGAGGVAIERGGVTITIAACPFACFGVVVGSGVGVVGVNVGIVGVVFVGVSFAAGAAADCCCRRLA